MRQNELVRPPESPKELGAVRKHMIRSRNLASGITLYALLWVVLRSFVDVVLRSYVFGKTCFFVWEHNEKHCSYALRSFLWKCLKQNREHVRLEKLALYMFICICCWLLLLLLLLYKTN